MEFGITYYGTAEFGPRDSDTEEFGITESAAAEFDTTDTAVPRARLAPSRGGTMSVFRYRHQC